MNEAELLTALRNAVAKEPEDDPGLSTHEMAVQLYGKSNAHTRHLVCLKVRDMMDAGTLKRGRRKFEMVDGRRRDIPVWYMP